MAGAQVAAARMSVSVGEAQFAELLPLLTHAQVLMVLRVLSVLRVL